VASLDRIVFGRRGENSGSGCWDLGMYAFCFYDCFALLEGVCWVICERREAHMMVGGVRIHIYSGIVLVATLRTRNGFPDAWYSEYSFICVVELPEYQHECVS